jgi:sugar lactone lactonase YvrE
LDGVGAAARFFYGPRGTVSDKAGNLFVADTEDNLIRKVVSATGAVTTLAGQAVAGSFADGTGADARFNGPRGLALDGAGNLFVADHGNWAIRKIVLATGAVTTLAGSANTRGSVDGTGAGAQFVGPGGIACDGAGNLYVTDTFESDGGFQTAIRKIAISTGVVTTLATLPGTFYDVPDNLAYDAAGNLYLAYDQTVAQVSLATGTVTTLAGVHGQIGTSDGGANARFKLPSGIFDDGAGDLYVADTANDRIRKVVIATGTVTTLTDSSGTPIDILGPISVAGDGAGTLFVTRDDNSIHALALATGAVSVLAGADLQPGSADGTGAAARFYDPNGITSDGAGNLFVADTYNGTIRKVVVATGEVTTLAGTAGQVGSQDGAGAAATFSRPTGIVSDRAGSLYVTDGNIRKIDVATRTVTTFSPGPARNPSTDPPPIGITFDGAGNLFFIDLGSAVYELTIATGNLRVLAGRARQQGAVNGTGGAARFSAPSGIVSDRAGNLYVADTGNDAIRKIVVATRAVTTLAGRLTVQGTADGQGGNARFSYPFGIDFDGAGNLYVADGNTIRKIVVANGTVSTVVGALGRVGVSQGPLPASLNFAYSVAVLPTGVLAIVDEVENAVLLASF